jgi:class 3 adenylate cyclase
VDASEGRAAAPTGASGDSEASRSTKTDPSCAVANPLTLARGPFAFLTEPPAHVQRGEHKLYRTRVAVCVVGVIIYAASAANFATLGFALPVVASVTGIVADCGLIVLARSGRHRLATVLLFVVGLGGVALLSVSLGPASGMPLFFLGIAPIPLMVFDETDQAMRVLFVSLTAFAGLVSLLIHRWVPPLYLLSSLPARFALIANAAGTFTLLVVTARYFAHAAALAEGALDRERAVAERLLLNILPTPIAQRLKDGAATIADAHPAVTVLFADLVGFTPLAAGLPSTEVVGVLNEVFSRFDRLAARFGLEKIKTIGDAYMAVAGLPDPAADHARRAADMALAMVDELAAYDREHDRALSIRVGLHAGAVTAGVIGVTKFSYDLWGDTVNTASRLESHGEPGRVHVSEAVRVALDGNAYTFEDRGLVPLKGKGELRTFFLGRRAPSSELSRR